VPAALLASRLKATRSTIGAWRKSFPHISQQETDYRIVINLLNFVEEHRALRQAEANLRCIIVNLLSRVSHAKLSFWNQQSKVRAAICGDENTRYFHVCANQRRRMNRIQVVEHDGREYHNHG